jgi:nucleoside 2-deoxyribosyltransferase
MRGYLANGLFSVGDRLVNEMIATRLRWFISDIDLFVPQEQMGINDKNSYADSLTIAKYDSEALMSSDFLIAVIDGVEIDSGVACEIGMFSTTGRPIFALYSDVRQEGRGNVMKIQALIDDGTENQYMYRNLFVIGVIKQTKGKICKSIDDLVSSIVGVMG